MKEYLCEKIYDSKENKFLETVGAIAIGALGAMTDSKAEKFQICIDEDNDSLSVIGIGHSAWGGVKEIKENEKEYYKLSDVNIQLTGDIITLERKKQTRKFKIVQE